jgi:hypothetical protein
MKHTPKVILSVLLSIFVSASYAQTWQNPFNLTGELVPHGIGDPYILKYKGVYYLYASNERNEPLRCWKSKDLVHWSDSIVCSTDPTISGAYAPEVVYWNGKFYMYTSPNGGGHYTLSSDSPTGPFTVISGNWGKEIDGSVFIDDDGKWYFYHAHNDGIHGAVMSGPTALDPSINLGLRMNNQWTEGPCVIKRNGVYYLIYTGNHVLSKGYRIDYAKSTSGAISGYTPQAGQNPILIQTEGAHVGLGHGTAFIGPDLDTYYFTYHNLVTIGGGQPYRKFNLDRIAFNDNKLSILGPTDWVQQDPILATSDYFDRTEIGTNWIFPNGGNWEIINEEALTQDVQEAEYKAIFTAATESDYTAELTLKEVARNNDTAKLGAVFSYSDEQNYGTALLNSSTNQLEINFLIDNVLGTPQYYDLPADFNYAVWHSIRIEKSEANYQFFVDGMLKASLTSNLGGGKVGYITNGSQGNFSYIALSDKVNGSGILDVYKPVPGTISGAHHVSDDQTKYNINVKSTGVYNIGFRYAAARSGSQVRIWQGETDLTGAVDLPNTGNKNNFRTVTIKGVNLTVGFQTLKVEHVSGDFSCYEMQFKPADNESFTIVDDFENGFSPEWNYSDGDWKIESGQAVINGFGKRAIGNAGWTDYTIETDITYAGGMNAGIIFRVNNPAIGGANDSPQLGTDYLQAYFVGLGSNNVALGKHNYGWETLTSASGSYSLNTIYHIKIVTLGANIKVYVNDMTTPKIDYTDTSPLISGKVGFRSCGVHVRFDNFSVTNSNETGIKDVSIIETELFPNPVHDALTINTDKKSIVSIYNTAGHLLISQPIDSSNNRINVEQLTKGVYVVKLSSETGEVAKKLIKE